MRQAIKKIRGAVTKCLLSCRTSWYVFCLEHLKVKPNTIFVETRLGESMGGNIFYLLQKISASKQSLSLFLVYKKGCKAKYTSILSNYGITQVRFLCRDGFSYYFRLATCKFLLNDTTLPPMFIKRRGQVYLNTWHGVPLKKMGIEQELEGYLFSNIQKNLLHSDYLLLPNEYMEENMIRANHLSPAYTGEILRMGQPRNAVFFDKKRSATLKTKLGLAKIQIIVYMPTWRGSYAKSTSTASDMLESHLEEFDNALTDSQIMFVKLHPLSKKVTDLTHYKHIKPFPIDYETYDFLNIADSLITDYSSVMFDFACTGRKIILFTYDIDDYLSERGCYLDIKELPFCRAKTTKDVISLINDKDAKGYVDDSFIKSLLKNENINATQALCDTFLNHIPQKHKRAKKDLLFFADNFVKNGIISALFSLLRIMDKSDRNCYVIIQERYAKDSFKRYEELPKDVHVISLKTWDYTLLELVACALYFEWNFDNCVTRYFVDRAFKRQFYKYFDIFDDATFVHFTGYGRQPTTLFLHAKKKIIFVHSNMKLEYEKKGNCHMPTLIRSYKEYDKIACVSQTSLDVARDLTKGQGNFCLVNNVIDAQNIIAKSKLPVEIDRDTTSPLYCSTGLNGFFEGNGIKFITIGRFSVEKQHLRLMEAFNKFWHENPTSKLIIIGGYGPLYDQTISYARSLACYKNICIIKSLSNPYSILKQCDLYISSSSHEGLPMTLYEATVLGIPILATDIGGHREFLNSYEGGMLVEESPDALYEGMKAFTRGEIKPLAIDIDKYNERCLKQFESLLVERK